MSDSWSLQTGAQLLPDGSVRFTVWAPRVRAPRVRLCTGAAQGDYPMEAVVDERGYFAAVVPNAGAAAEYVFVIDDGRELPDPVSRWQPHGVHGASRVVDPAFGWTDDYWRGVPMDQMALYELHVGTFTPEGTFEAIIPRLPELKALGIRAIELMPIGQFPGERNWGYDGVGLYAAQNSYGGPLELKKLIDAAHAHRLGVVLDVVYNHLGPEGNNLDAFGPYFTDQYKTPWGRALNFDGPDSDAVRRFVLDNACYWVAEYHVDGVRLDAVHEMFDSSAFHVLEEIAAVVHARGAEQHKSIVVIAESDLNDPRLVRPQAEHGLGLDAQWSDDFHHAVHSVLTGETNGYYSDFGDASLIADVMREPFIFDGRYSGYRRRRHGRPSVGIPSKSFVVALQNHDQVGNRARGDRLATLVSAEQLRLAAALLMLSPYMPLVFMGEEYGETRPFQYFVSHGDADLVTAVQAGRRAEFAAFHKEAEVPDPQDEATFARSRVEWSKRSDESHAQLLALYRDLLALRRDESLMRPDRARILVDNDAPGWMTILRESTDEYADYEPTLLAVFNCTAEALDVPLPDSAARAWTLRLSTDAAAYGGSAELAGTVAVESEEEGPRRLLAAPALPTVRVPPWTAALYVAETDRAYPGR